MDIDIEDALEELEMLKKDKDEAWMPLFNPDASEISNNLDSVEDF